MTRQSDKRWRAVQADIAAAAKQRHNKHHSRSAIPPTVSHKDRITAVQTAAKNRKDKHMSLGKQEVVDALKAMSESEAKAVYAEARATGRQQAMERAAAAVRAYVGGTPRTEEE
jgi:hypothetical protein